MEDIEVMAAHSHLPPHQPQQQQPSASYSPSATLPQQRRPGLHGRAKIWGPNKTSRMILLTTALMGLQFTWSVEMAYGTPFLLQLGLSKSLMSLVWLAGPLSGLVMQPVVGVLSDKCTSKLGRRRPFLIVGVSAVVISFLFLGWCKEIVTAVLGAGHDSLAGATILLAVGSIYILDFAINCVQASCRTLIVDSLPSSLQEEAASWASRLMGLGGIFGYFMGNVNLPLLFPAFGDTQIKGLCVIACLFLVLTVGATCITVTERVMVRAPKATSTSSVQEFTQGFKTILRSIRYLPTRIQYLCNVQFFAWMGWFPFLFYSSTYIAEIYSLEQSSKGTPVEGENPGEATSGVEDAAVRAGSYCLLIYSIVSLGASIMLPVFVSPADQVISGASSGPFSSSRMGNGSHISSNNSTKRSRLLRRYWPWWLRLPVPGLTLPRMYTLSLALVSFSLMGTWLIQDLSGSTILFSLCGIAWAVSMWAPFSILGEVISKQMQDELRQETAASQGSGGHHRVSHDGNNGHDDLDDELEAVEDIPMSENRQYQPVRIRESLEEIVTMETDHRPHIPKTDSHSSAYESDVRLSHLDPESDNSESDSNEPSQGRGAWRKNREEKRRLVKHRQGPHPAHSQPTSWDPSNRQRHSLVERHLSQVDANRHRRPLPSPFRSSSVDIPDISSANAPMGYDPASGSAASSASTPRSPLASPLTTPPVHSPSESTSAGALLGIHNIYIVLPQFLVSFLSSLVFAAIEPKSTEGAGKGGIGLETSQEQGDPDTIGVMLRFGGLMAGIAALLSLKLWKQPRTIMAPTHQL